MDIQQLKAQAQERVANAHYDAKKLALLFTGAAVTLSFLITLIGFLLTKQMEGTGGLGGIGLRTALSSIQTLVMLAGSVALPYWNLGYTRAALDTARDGSAEPRTLLSGFRLFFPALRLFFLQAMLYTLIITLGAQAGSILYLLSPFSTGAITMTETILAGGEAMLADPETMEQLLRVLWPMYLIVGILLLIVFIPVMYRLRLVEFSLVDGKEKALQNMLRSNYVMRGNCLWMFRLDLSFWWYFLLQGLAAVLAYGDLLIGGGDVAYWVFYLLSAAAQLFVGWKFLPQVHTSYALVYDFLLDKKGQRT